MVSVLLGSTAGDVCLFSRSTLGYTASVEMGAYKQQLIANLAGGHAVSSTLISLLGLGFCLGFFLRFRQEVPRTPRREVSTQTVFDKSVSAPWGSLALCGTTGLVYNLPRCAYVPHAGSAKLYSPCCVCIGSESMPMSVEPQSEAQVHEQSRDKVRRRIAFHRALKHGNPAAEPEMETLSP